tara:strand:- start:55 stop:888 length:834 start_codon:yes stop_codon:yes gene_type:complete
MKTRHNKKRNTAFIYESLIKEATAAIIKNDHDTKKKVVTILKKHFSEGSILKRHLDCYRSLYESRGLDADIAEKIIKEAKLSSRLLDTQGLFVSQSDLIKDVNQQFTNQFYNTFVPNYKTLASIAQILSDKLSPKSAVILERQIVDYMTEEIKTESETELIDDLALASFIDKFNSKYDDELLEEQKALLNFYISSFVDNSLALKSFLNEEISRLKAQLKESLSNEHIKDDLDMSQKTEEIITKLDDFYSENINERVLMTVLKTQKLVREITNDGDID